MDNKAIPEQELEIGPQHEFIPNCITIKLASIMIIINVSTQSMNDIR